MGRSRSLCPNGWPAHEAGRADWRGAASGWRRGPEQSTCTPDRGGVRNDRPRGPRTGPKSRWDAAGGTGRRDGQAAGEGPRGGCGSEVWPQCCRPDAVPHTPGAGPEAPPPRLRGPAGEPCVGFVPWVPAAPDESWDCKSSAMLQTSVWTLGNERSASGARRPETPISFPITVSYFLSQQSVVEAVCPPHCHEGVWIPGDGVLLAISQVQVLVWPVDPRHRAGHGRGLQDLSRGRETRGVLRPPAQGCVALPSPRHHAEAPGLALPLDPGGRRGPGLSWAAGCPRPSRRPAPKEPGPLASSGGERGPSALSGVVAPPRPAARLPSPPGSRFSHAARNHLAGR